MRGEQMARAREENQQGPLHRQREQSRRPYQTPEIISLAADYVPEQIDLANPILANGQADLPEKRPPGRRRRSCEDL